MKKQLAFNAEFAVASEASIPESYAMFLNLLTPSYWFTLAIPVVTNAFGLAVAIASIGMIVAAIILKFLRRKAPDSLTKHLEDRIKRLCSTMGIIGLIMLFFSYEQAYLIGSRFWYLFWIVGILIWTGFILKYALKDIPSQKAKYAELAEKQKYLPR